MNKEKLSSAENLMPEELYSDMGEAGELQKSENLFRILFQKAYYEEYEEVLHPQNPLDLSFLDEITKTDRPQTTDIEEVLQQVKHHRLMLRVAAVLLAGFILISGMTVIWNSQFAYAARFQLEKAMYQISGKYFTSDADLNRRTDTISISVSSMEDMDQATRFMPELYIPSFIPEGWELDRLELMKTLQGDYTAEYIFINGDGEQFQIDEVLAENAVVTDFMESQKMELQNRTVKRMTDPYTLLNCIQFTENDCLVTISGDLKDDELSEVADHMIQKQ